MGANVKFETVNDLIKRQANLRVICSCGRSSVVDGKALARWYACHMFDLRFTFVRDHLRCSRCKGQPEEVRITAEHPTAPNRFPQTEDQWGKLVKRLRNR